jgi:uncharacterized repeat protein (TIGR01451 family)
MNISSKNIASIEGIGYFKSLRNLNCNNNKISIIPILPDSIYYLGVGSNLITSLPAHLPDSLQTLELTYSKITTLGKLPDNLLNLYANNCGLESVLEFPKKLKEIQLVNDSLTVLPELPDSLEFLLVINNKLTHLPSLLSKSKLKLLLASNNQITSIPNTPSSLKTLSIENNKIEGISNIANGLDQLSISNNLLTSIDNLPPSITKLFAGNNKIQIINNLPDSLKDCSLSSNQINQIIKLPNNINYLYLDGNKLTSLPTLPNKLKTLEISYNEFEVLPILPNELNELTASYNLLSTLPFLPLTLTKLDISSNKYIEIPKLNTGLKNFKANYNQIISIAEFPDSLNYIEVIGNRLNSLPPLNNQLISLSCGGNYISELPSLNGNLKTLSCYRNLIKKLPNFPIGLETVYTTTNPLKCLPPLPISLKTLTVKRTKVTCLPNNVSGLTVDTTLSICSGSSGTCSSGFTVKGRVYNDINLDGQYNFGEPLLSDKIVKVEPGNWVGVTKINGIYQVPLDSFANNVWKLIDNSKTIQNIVPEKYDLQLQRNSGDFYDFGIQYKPKFYDLCISLYVGRLRPFTNTYGSMFLNNIGTTSQGNIRVKLAIPNGLTFSEASITPTTINTDTIIWENINIDSFASKRIDFTLFGSNLRAGDAITIKSYINGIYGDSTPLNNISNYTGTVVNSYDPNDKIVDKPTIPTDYSNNDEELTYRIRFQNTGTDTAYNVVIQDELPEELDITSLQVLGASHKYELSIIDKNLLEISFPNINLVDSFANEPLSNGFIILKFKVKPGLLNNDNIENLAGIIFDYNSPIITNKAITKVSTLTSIVNNNISLIKIYPNPAKDILNISSMQDNLGICYISDFTGKVVEIIDLNKGQDVVQISLSKYSSGIYFINSTFNKICLGKFIVTK